MKIKLAFALFLILAISPFAQSLVGQEGMLMDYESPDVVNALSTEDLGLALEEDKIPDLEIIYDDKIIGIIEEKPEMLDNENVLEDLEKRISENPDIINNNTETLTAWLEKYGISNGGGKIDNFDNGMITTRGDHSTTFEIDGEYVDKILPNGEVKLKKGGTLFGCDEVKKGPSGELLLKGGHADLTGVENSSLYFVGKGLVTLDDSIFESPGAMRVKIEDGISTMSGNNIFEKDSNGRTLSRFSGEVLTYSEGNHAFMPGTEYTSFWQHMDNFGEERTFSVSSFTEYTTNGVCDGYENCIQDIDGNLKIASRDGNKIILDDLDNSVKSLEISEIGDSSSVVFNNGKDLEMVFSSDPISVKGDLTKLTTNIESTFTNKDGKQFRQVYTSDGGIVQCQTGMTCDLKDTIGNSFEDFPNRRNLGDNSGEYTEVIENDGRVSYPPYPSSDNVEVFISSVNEQGQYSIIKKLNGELVSSNTYDQDGRLRQSITPSGTVDYPPLSPEPQEVSHIARVVYPPEQISTPSQSISQTTIIGKTIVTKSSDGNIISTCIYNEDGNLIAESPGSNVPSTYIESRSASLIDSL